MSAETLIQVAALEREMSSYSNAELLDVIEGYEEGRYCKEQAMAACRVVLTRTGRGEWFKSKAEADQARLQMSMSMRVAA